MDKKQSKYEEDLVSGIIREFNKLKGDRGNWESQWQEIAERFWPMQSRLFMGQAGNSSDGDQRTEQVFDSTPCIALSRFAAILDSLLTPRNQTWHRLRASDDSLNRDRECLLWFEELNRTLFKYRYAPLANFASQNNLNYKMLGAYGSGCMFIDALKNNRGKKEGLRYKNVHLSGVYFKENHQGIVDTIYRFYKQDARQAYQEFGDKLPKEIKDAYEAKKFDKKFDFINCVQPRSDYDPKRIDVKGMPFGGYTVAMGQKFLVEETGFNTFPYAASRYEQAPEEVYGRSPAMDTMPAVRTLNEQKKTVLKQGHKAVDPVLIGYDDGVFDMFSHRPGALNSGGVDMNGRPLIQALPVGNLAIGKEMMDDERAVINDAFLITLFQILTENPQMTATEVLERTREKGMLIEPNVGRQQSEYLGPMIEREIDIIVAQGLISKPPQILVEAKGEYRIEYDSPMSRSSRAEEAAGGMRTIEVALNISAQTQNPAVLDPFNFDVILPEMADINGMPEHWKRSDDEIAELRQARSQTAEQAQAIQAAPAAAAVMKANAVQAKESAPAA